MQRNNTVTILAAVLGLLALGLTAWWFMRSRGGGAPAPGTTADATPTRVTQLVAAQDVPPRTELTPQMFQEEEVAEGKREAGALASFDALRGKMSREAIRRGEVVTARVMADRITRVIPANIPVPEGMRAVALWVDPNQTAAGLVDAGDRVDVIATHRMTAEKQRNEKVVGPGTFIAGRTIAQDLQVLAVDRSIAASTAGVPSAVPGAPAAAPTPAPANQPAQPKTRVVVAASPADAVRLVAANEEGKIHLTIRNPVTRERYAVPEAREYPSRIVNVPDPDRAEKAAKLRSDEQRALRQERLQREAMALRSQQSVTVRGGSGDRMVPPMPSPLMGGGIRNVPPAANEKEVTVIRGTQKTTVAVPPG